MSEGKYFSGKMKTIELTPTDVEAIRKLYEIDCEWFNKQLDIPGNAKTKECPVHLIRHHRTPDPIAIEEIVTMYPAISMQQIGDVFGVTREAIRLQYVKGNNKSWAKGKTERLYGTEPDIELIEKILTSWTSTINRTTLEITANVFGKELGYINYWARNNEEVSSMLEEAKLRNTFNRDNPTEKRCNRCKEISPIDNFYKDKNSRDKKSPTCIPCSKRQVRVYMDKRQEEFDNSQIVTEKVCRRCGVLKNRSKYSISRSSNDGLQTYCNPCQNIMTNSNPKRREKFVELEIDKDHVCVSCNQMKEFWQFYLVRQPNKPENYLVAPSCQDCCNEAYMEIELELPFISNSRFTGLYRKALQRQFNYLMKLTGVVRPMGDINYSMTDFMEDKIMGFEPHIAQYLRKQGKDIDKQLFEMWKISKSQVSEEE